MDIVRSLALGIAASLVPFAVFGVTGQFGWWTSVTVGLVGATVAALTHRLPQRRRLGRHLLATLPAALALPALMVLVTAAAPAPPEASMHLLVVGQALLAGALGVAVVRMLRRDEAVVR